MNRTDYFDDQDDSDRIHKKTAFILEGVLLLVIAVIGITGNLLAIVTILSQKVLTIFHDLLLVLTVFDMVCTKHFKIELLQSKASWRWKGGGMKMQLGQETNGPILRCNSISIKQDCLSQGLKLQLDNLPNVIWTIMFKIKTWESNSSDKF